VCFTGGAFDRASTQEIMEGVAREAGKSSRHCIGEIFLQSSPRGSAHATKGVLAEASGCALVLHELHGERKYSSIALSDGNCTGYAFVVAATHRASSIQGMQWLVTPGPSHLKRKQLFYAHTRSRVQIYAAVLSSSYVLTVSHGTTLSSPGICSLLHGLQHFL
jgi:hypothetical protein